MLVEKRDGTTQEVSFDKILNRIRLLCSGEEFTNKIDIDPVLIAQKVCTEIFDGVKTSKLDELASETAVSLYSQNPDYAVLASRIVISNHIKSTYSKFSEVVEKLHSRNILQDYLHDIVTKNRELIDNEIKESNDYNIDFFGFKTLQKSLAASSTKIGLAAFSSAKACSSSRLTIT